MKKLDVTAMLFSVLILAGAVRADPDVAMLDYIEWIVANSDLEYHGEPLPEIVTESAGLLEVRVYGEQTVATAELQGNSLPEVFGAYADGVLYLRDDADPTSFEDAPVMVHELVHYLQDINGVTDECLPANEPQAYRLHGQWMDEHGHDGDLRPDPLFVLMLEMACQDMMRMGPL